MSVHSLRSIPSHVHSKLVSLSPLLGFSLFFMGSQGVKFVLLGLLDHLPCPAHRRLRLVRETGFLRARNGLSEGYPLGRCVRFLSGFFSATRLLGLRQEMARKKEGGVWKSSTPTYKPSPAQPTLPGFRPAQSLVPPPSARCARFRATLTAFAPWNGSLGLAFTPASVRRLASCRGRGGRGIRLCVLAVLGMPRGWPSQARARLRAVGAHAN